MKRIVRFTDGIVAGDDMRQFSYCLLGYATDKYFKQRKQYDEYYFTEFKVELTIDVIESLSKEFYLEIGNTYLNIRNRF